MDGAQSPAAQIRLAAMNALARREHSRSELEQKLSGRFADCRGLIARELDALAEQGLQSDQRFVEMLCTSRVGRGHGRLRIASELRHKGITPEQAAAALDALSVDWFELAAEVARRRFGETPAADYRDRGKRVRYLQYRGFTQDQIRHALGD